MATDNYFHVGAVNTSCGVSLWRAVTGMEPAIIFTAYGMGFRMSLSNKAEATTSTLWSAVNSRHRFHRPMGRSNDAPAQHIL